MDKEDKAMVEMLMLKIKTEVEDKYNSKEFKDTLIKKTTIYYLKKYKKNKKISNTQYKLALDILNGKT